MDIGIIQQKAEEMRIESCGNEGWRTTFKERLG